jgi:hypothetical protein
LALTDQLLKHLSTPSPSPPHPPNQTTTTPAPFRPGVGFGAGWPRSYRPRSYSRPGTYKSPKATPGSVMASVGQAPDAAPTNSNANPASAPKAPNPRS